MFLLVFKESTSPFWNQVSKVDSDEMTNGRKQLSFIFFYAGNVAF